MVTHAGCKGCSSFPHGLCKTLVVITMALVSLALAISVHAVCFFVRGNDSLSTGFGIWTKENVVPTPTNEYQCQEYTFAETYLKDTKWNAAAGCAFTAGMLGFLFLVFLVGASCASYSRAFWKLAGANYTVAGILDFCALVGVSSDICATFTTLTYGNSTTVTPATECTFSTGAILAVIAGICFWITAVLCFCMPPAKSNNDSEHESDSAVVKSSAAASTNDKKDDEEEAPPETAKNDSGDEQQEEATADASANHNDDDVEMDLKSAPTPTDNGEMEKGDDSDVNQEDVAAGVDTAEPIDKDSNTSSNASVIEDEIGNTGFWIMLSDNILFLIGSVMFMWMAVMDLDWSKTVQTWVDADVINGNFDVRDNYLQEIANYTWTDDDYVFENRFHWVSKYAIVYFIAALAFTVEGYLEFFVTPGIRGLWFTFAGGTGLLAAWLSERDVYLSNIFSLISAHLFVLEAIGLVWNRSDFSGKLGWYIKIVDVCFVIATTMDVVLSYTTLFNVFRMSLVRTDTAAASLWLFCSVAYVGLTLYAKKNGYFDKTDKSQTG